MIVTSRTELHVQETCELVTSHGGTAQGRVLDVADDAAVRELSRSISEGFGRLDILVCNAGVDLTRAPAVWETTDEEWSAVMDVNVNGIFRVSRALVPLIPRGGSIVTIGSINSFVGWRDNAAYTTSKGAVLMFTRALALDVAERGIRANCVCPGAVETSMWEQIDKEWGALEGLGQGEAWKRRIRHIPLGRPERAEDVANVVAFLAGPDSDYMTGQAINVDGGIVMGS